MANLVYNLRRRCAWDSNAGPEFEKIVSTEESTELCRPQQTLVYIYVICFTYNVTAYLKCTRKYL